MQLFFQGGAHVPLAPPQLHYGLHQTLYQNFQKKERPANLPSCQFRAPNIVKRKHFLQSSSSDKTHLLNKKRFYSLSQQTQRAIYPDYLEYDARLLGKHLDNVNKQDRRELHKEKHFKTQKER